MNSTTEPATPVEHRIEAIRLEDSQHCEALGFLLDTYAAGPTGRGAPLSQQARESLPGLLHRLPHYRGWLAFAGSALNCGGQPAGLVNAFLGVSTFRARLLLNIHDICVHPNFQRRGIGTALLRVVEHAARSEGCCKITLEVLEGNLGALATYRRAGFGGYRLDPALGQAILLEKLLGEA
jgi:ribosomal protein S18 acetylase RimI-like enzyme